ncbi:MAG: CHC2 zinc finger domain-containing protein [Acutalibacteraceae bacterium]
MKHLSTANAMNKYSNDSKEIPDYSVYAEQAKAVLPFGEVAAFYGVDFNSKGFALCPFHNEKTGSFGVTGNKGHCFGCGWHGDIIQFVSNMFGLNFRGAVEKLNTDFSLGLPIGRKLTIREAMKISASRKHIERERAERERCEAEKLKLFGDLWGEYSKLDKVIAEFAPKGPDEELKPQFVSALKRIEYIGFLIDNEL